MNVENKDISITLPTNAWNVIMNALGQRPYLEVAELIANIKVQAENQLQKQEPLAEPGE